MLVLARCGFIVLACLLAVATPTDTRSAEPSKSYGDTDWKKGKLGHLFQYIGTYNFQPIFDDPYVRGAMENLLGDEVPHLLNNMEVRIAIELHQSNLVLFGARAHEAHKENAVLVVDIYDGEIHAGIFSNGFVTIYSKFDDETAKYFSRQKLFELLPGSILRFAHWEEVSRIIEKEPVTNFKWIGNIKNSSQ